LGLLLAWPLLKYKTKQFNLERRWKDEKCIDNLRSSSFGSSHCHSSIGETAQLRDEIRAKSAELNALLSSPNPDAEKAKALQKEISDLRARLAQSRINFVLEERKVTPYLRFSRGYNGHHMRGYGHGMGHGWHMGGYGPGGC